MKTTLISLFIIQFTFQLTAQTEKITQSKLESATIFRLGAEMVHSAKASLSAGNNDVTIEGISASVDQNSLQIKCSGGVTIMSSEFLKDHIAEMIPAPEVKRLQDSIKYYSKENARLSANYVTNEELQELLQDNKSIGGEQAGLSVAELIKMMDYYELKSNELQAEKIETEEKIRTIEKKISKFQAQLNQESLKNDKITGKLKLKLVCPLVGAYDLTVSYYTPLAYWIPYYDLHASATDKPIKMISKAKIMQTTGLDWKKVMLTLSTSTPNNGKIAPVISAWFLDYVRPVANSGHEAYARMELGSAMGLAQNSISYMNASADLEKKAPSTPTPPVYIVEGRVVSTQEFTAIDQKMIASVKMLNDQSSKDTYGSDLVYEVKLKTNFVSESENQSDITYKIDLPYDVLGTGTEQSVTLRSLDLPANYEYYSVPRLDKSVFLLAGISDWAKYNLLPGEANVMYDGTYSGKSTIDPNSTKDILHLTLGNDKRIIVKREKMQDFSSTKLLGNDKKQVFTYQLTVKNNKNVPVNMILKDQYPISSDKTIVVEMLEASSAHVNEEVGSLTWEFPLQAGESRSFKISYSVKYQKDKQINL